MGLRIADHLQAMLGPAQRQVQAAKHCRLRRFDPAFPGKSGQRRKRASLPQGMRPAATDKLQEDIKRDLQLMYEHYYPLQVRHQSQRATPLPRARSLPTLSAEWQRTKDVAFEVGRVFMGLRDYTRAVEFFEASQSQCGEHHVSWYDANRDRASRLPFPATTPAPSGTTSAYAETIQASCSVPRSVSSGVSR